MNHVEGSDLWDSGRFARQLSALGERVRAARQSHAWSQQDLGNRTEIDRANLSRVEGGKKNITLDVLWRLASGLEVQWADLLDERTTGPAREHRISVSFDQQLIAFGTRVYQARVLQRIAQQALADRVGIGPSTIYWIEAGTRNVTLETLSRLAAGLRVHWADLLDDRTTDPAQPASSRVMRVRVAATIVGCPVGPDAGVPTQVDRCRQCQRWPADTWLDRDGPLCDECADARLSARTGYPRLPGVPEPVLIAGPDGRRHVLRYRISRAPTGICLRLVEEHIPRGEGYEFAVLGEHHADVAELIAGC